MGYASRVNKRKKDENEMKFEGFEESIVVYRVNEDPNNLIFLPVENSYAFKTIEKYNKDGFAGLDSDDDRRFMAKLFRTAIGCFGLPENVNESALKIIPSRFEEGYLFIA